MRAGLGFLVVAYCFSQFFRAFLAVLSPVLQAEIGATTGDLALASGLWFAIFAVMQVPVGWSLDSFGPRRTTAILFGFGAVGGTAVFAMAQGPAAVLVAMGLIGIGCAPVLMAAYFIFARQFPAAMFGTLAGVTVGVSSLGNLVSAAPLAWAVEAFGWRETLWAIAVVSGLIALGVAVFVRDPEKPRGEARGSFAELLRIRALWPILAGMLVCYAPVAGIRGLWIGPYATDFLDATLAQVGTATLVMGLAMVAGNFAYGFADRMLPGRKPAILLGNLCVAALCLWLFAAPPASLAAMTALFAAIGLFGASYPAVMAHGRTFLPPHLTGRGVAMLNLFGIGGAGIMQFASGPAHARLSAGIGIEAAYGALFAGLAAAILVGLAAYAVSKERPD